MEGNLTQDLHVFGVLLHYVTDLFWKSSKFNLS